MSKRLCLLVDDEQAIRGYLRAILENRQFETVEAEDGVSALRIAQKLGGHFDCVVTDIRMPGDMSGLDLAHWLRSKFPAVPIILISGYCDEDKVAGFRCIPKPFRPETIWKAIEEAVNPRTEGTVCLGADS